MTAPETFDQTCTVSTLRALEQFAEVPEAQLEWLISRGSCAIHEEGEQVFKPGDPIDALQIMLNGRVRYYTMQQGNQRQLGEFAAPFIAGTLPYSRLREATGYGMTIERTRVLNVHRDHFPEMIKEHYELTAALVHHMTNRVRNFTVFQQQNEKLMSLG
ncbi:MAG: cyclic nucleotide-binding domain-containing protein, partial [Bacteroidota bacterium]